MSSVSPAVLIVIVLALALMFALWVAWLRAMWALVKVGLFFGTVVAAGFLVVWAWHHVLPA